MSEYIQLPPDMTYEEACFLNIVKQKMLQKLNDRERFLFVYIFELGHPQNEAAFALNVNETNVSRSLKNIREKLREYKQY